MPFALSLSKGEVLARVDASFRSGGQAPAPPTDVGATPKIGGGQD